MRLAPPNEDGFAEDALLMANGNAVSFCVFLNITSFFHNARALRAFFIVLLPKISVHILDNLNEVFIPLK